MRHSANSVPFVILYAIAPTVGDTGIGQSILQRLKANVSLPVHVHTPAKEVFEALPEMGSQDRVRGRFPRIPLASLRSPLLPFKARAFVWDLRETGGRNVLPEEVYEALRQTLEGCVAVIWQGGPSWNDRFLSWKKVLERWLFMEVARHYGCLMYHVGVGAGPFAWGYPEKLWMRPLARRALNQYTTIFVRDRTSKPAIERLGAMTPVVASTDAAVYLRAAPDPQFADVERLVTEDKTRLRLAVCVRDYQANYPAAQQHRETVVRNLAAVLDTVQREKADVFFLSTDHHTSPAKASDLEVAHRVQNLMQEPGSVIIPRDVANAAALKHIYGMFDGLLSMRLHPCIFALELGVPSLVVSYDQKCDDFFARLGLSNYVYPLHNVDVESVAHATMNMLEDASLRASIKAAYGGLQERHRHDYDTMFESVRARAGEARGAVYA